MAQYLNIQSIVDHAKNILPPDVFNFISTGSFDEITLKRNKIKNDEILIIPRVLRCIQSLCTHTQVLENTVSSPILIAPTAYQKLVHEEGELAMLHAANQMNTIFTVPMFSSTNFETLAKQAEIPLWLQMYLLKDRTVNERLIRLAENLGYQAIILTVDAPVYGHREGERRTPLQFPDHVTFPHLKEIGIPFDQCIQDRTHFTALLDQSIGWEDIEWLGKITSLPIILKGILDPRDTEIAMRYSNIKGVIVSNHGGRQLDSTVSAIEVVEDHKRITQDKINLFIDGGVTRGSDVFKALALGADAVMIGRPTLWGLAVGGSDGVCGVFELLIKELTTVMALSGCASLNEITRDFVRFDEAQTLFSEPPSSKEARKKLRVYG